MSQIPSDGYLDPDGHLTPMTSKDAPPEANPPVPSSGAVPAAATDPSLRERAQKIVDLRRSIKQGFVWFALVNVLLWGSYLAGLFREDPKWFPWPLFVTFFWGGALMAQRKRLRELETGQSEVDAEVQRLERQQSRE